MGWALSRPRKTANLSLSSRPHDSIVPLYKKSTPSAHNNCLHLHLEILCFCLNLWLPWGKVPRNQQFQTGAQAEPCIKQTKNYHKRVLGSNSALATMEIALGTDDLGSLPPVEHSSFLIEPINYSFQFANLWTSDEGNKWIENENLGEQESILVPREEWKMDARRNLPPHFTTATTSAPILNAQRKSNYLVQAPCTYVSSSLSNILKSQTATPARPSVISQNVTWTSASSDTTSWSAVLCWYRKLPWKFFKSTDVLLFFSTEIRSLYFGLGREGHGTLLSKSFLILGRSLPSIWLRFVAQALSVPPPPTTTALSGKAKCILPSHSHIIIPSTSRDKNV